MVDLDIDIWGYGRDAAQAGRLSDRMLKACYPFVETKGFSKHIKFMTILTENFPYNHNNQNVYLVRRGFIVFQNKEDAELFRALIYIY